MERIGIVGMGLIGGSIGLALRARVPRIEIVGADIDPSCTTKALDSGAITHRGSLEEVAASVPLLVLAAPVDALPELCDTVAAAANPATTVTDVASTKSGPVTAGESAFGGRFVGGHPMAGSERHGIDAASSELFEGASWLLTPTDTTSPEAYAAVTALVWKTGAHPVATGPEAHDSLVARLSHLPQLVASTLVHLALGDGAPGNDKDALLGVAGGGFRDVTRIAASNPDLWVSILRSNRDAVLSGLEGLGLKVQELSGWLRDDRWDDIAGYLTVARAARIDLFAKPAFGGEPVTLLLLVPDRPGVLAEVTTAAGSLGANIEDLRIFHSTEGGRGRLELVVAGDGTEGGGGTTKAEALVTRLEALGYRVEREQVVE